MESLTPQAHRLAAILVLVVALWVSEALPLAVSALLGPLLAIVLQVAPAPKALALVRRSHHLPVHRQLHPGRGDVRPRAGPPHRLQRRSRRRLVGRSAGRLLVVFGGVSVVLSMWISNTATAAMMFPIGLSIVSHLSALPIARHPRFRRFATTLMLITAFGASIGGMATPIGTPPNLIGVGMLRELVGRANLVLPLDDARPADLDRPLRGARHRVLDCRRARPATARGHRRRWCAANSASSDRSRAASAT
ncbi:MAG: SLC13 family permease [Ignavibacteriales bacterium]|nr:SLC13 family permease [Ignavibacteriales bacterium]